MSKRLLPISLIALAVSTAAAPALAADPMTETKSTVVSYADVNISTGDGAQVLYRRIKMAAGSVCGPEPRIVDLNAYAGYEACVRDSLNRAVANSGSPLVAQLAGVAPVMVASR